MLVNSLTTTALPSPPWRQRSGGRLVALLVATLLGCWADPVGPEDRLRLSADPAPAAVLDGHPGEPLNDMIRVRATTRRGDPIQGARVTWLVTGAGAAVWDAGTRTDVTGSATARWVLGERAGETQALEVVIVAGSSKGTLRWEARAVPHVMARLQIVPPGDTTLRVGDTLMLRAEAEDPFGNRFAAPAPRWAVAQASLATVDSLGRLVAGPQRGATRVTATSADSTAELLLSVVQYVARLDPTPDTLRLSALGDTVHVPVRVLDDRGFELTDTVPVIDVADSSVVIPAGDGRLVSRGVGVTDLHLALGSASTSLPVLVEQVPYAITASLAETKAIVNLPLGDRVPLRCRALDRNGFDIAAPVLDVRARHGGVATATSCDSVPIVRSGFDTLVVATATDTVALPVVLAVAPRPSGPIGELVRVDDVPAELSPWTVSARRNTADVIELYFTGFYGGRGHLHRLLSDDGVSFRYDGVVLQHDPSPCDLQGTGIENVAVVPRSDGPGWRMFFAAGSNVCYGWQVFSAVSEDDRTWTKEPGIRLSNGGSAPPDPPSTPPWPVGEGMVVEQLPDGEWRMIVSSYEHTDPPEDAWQITEWRSPNQLDWHYRGVVLTTRDMPLEGQASVYSPTIIEFAPGLWRMVFTGDNRHSPGARSRLWSAVSIDQISWQLEGELLGAVGVDLYYCALVGEHLYFIRRDGTGPFQIGTATVAMP